jgi:Fur family peroxide stress response transcriptional regulator
MNATYRSSRQRDRILEALRNTNTHPTADWIYAKIKGEFPKLSLGTVYRNIAVLIDQGLVQRIQSGSTFDRFEANPTFHYHLICERCGRISDFKMPLDKDLEKEASQLTDFTIHHHRIDFYGICPQCKQKE